MTAKRLTILIVLVLCAGLLLPGPGRADDTCIFTVTADSVPPNVILLLDNGAAMEEISGHSNYTPYYQNYWENTFDYDSYGPYDSLRRYYGDEGYYFFNKNGYIMDAGYLRRVGDDLLPDPSDKGIPLSGGVVKQPGSFYFYRYWNSYTYDYFDGTGYADFSGKSTYSYGYNELVSTLKVGDPVVAASGASGVVRKIDSAIPYPVPGDVNDPDGDGYITYTGDIWEYDSFGNPVKIIGTYTSTYRYEYLYVRVIETSGEFAKDAVTETSVVFGKSPNKFTANNPYFYVRRYPYPQRASLTLPAVPSTTQDAAGIKDNATTFRYSRAYLNWLFQSYIYSGGTGADLPAKSRFYYAKKAILDTGKLTSNKAKFAVYAFTATSVGASNVQPLGDVVKTVAIDPLNNVLDPNFITNINNMGTVTFSPLAEGLADLGGVYAGKSISGQVATDYCQKSFNIVVTAGVSSKDDNPSSTGEPLSQDDYDGDSGDIGEGKIKVGSADPVDIPVGLNGTTYLDDVAQYLYTHDIVGYRAGFQNVATYTVGVMTNQINRAFLINTSNNGNGNFNLYDETDPEYGKYHFEASSPDGITSALLAALKTVLSRTTSFTAPVVPVTRTTSGELIYLSFFKPSAENFWQGDITKFGLNQDNEIIDRNGNRATEENGAMKTDAAPYWSTKNWADSSKPNYMANSTRKIYTYLGSSKTLSSFGNTFATYNGGLTAEMLGNPVVGRNGLINYIRGADVLDEDNDGNTTENRRIIHADALHGEPLIVSYGSSTRMLYFAANDGMLHAVNDSNGREEWGFIPPDQLSRLQLLIEGYEHPYFLDASPKAFIYDHDQDGVILKSSGDKVIIVCGARQGGSSYFALDVTDPLNPELMWRISAKDDHRAGTLKLASISGTFVDGEDLVGSSGGSATVDGALRGGSFLDYVDRGTSLFPVGATVTGGTSGATGTVVAVTHNASPADANNTTIVYSELGETWSEPSFGKVRVSNGDSVGTHVMFIGGGFSPDNSSGQAIIAVDVESGARVETFKNGDNFVTGMDYGIPSPVLPVDADNNGFVDKLYVGDMGGQIWRVGKFDIDMDGNALTFPSVNENIKDWTAEVLFSSGCDDGLCGDGLDNDADGIIDEYRRFFYAPDLTLEFGYDLLFIGSGDRNNACTTETNNRIYAIRDNHVEKGFTESDLVDMTDGTGMVDLETGADKGFFLRLAPGEKILAEGTVFYKVFYVTSFLSSAADPCKPGGDAILYAVNYKTGKGGADLNNDGVKDMQIVIGGGIGSKPVTVIREGGQTLLVSVGSTNPDATTENTGAGIVDLIPDAPPFNFFFLWWQEMFN